MNYESIEIRCTRCGAEMGYVYVSGRRPKRAYCPACFRWIMAGEGSF